MNGPAIELRLDPSSGAPAYLQIAQQVAHAVQLGRLVVGDRLPTVKEAVASLAINPNTVLKAYRELEREGLVEGRPGVGTFVTAAPTRLPVRDVQALRRSLGRWLDQASSAGLDDTAIRGLVADELTARNQASSGVAS